MKITFVTSGFGLSGGTKAIFEFTNHLVDMGHEVNILCSLTPFWLEGKWINKGRLFIRFVRIFKKSKGCKACVNWFNVKANLKPIWSYKEKYIPDADIIVATWWETAYFVKRYGAKKGKKFYLIQDHEIWMGNDDAVNKTYQIGLKNIVNSRWLKKTLKEKAETSVEEVILHAPDHHQFYPERSSKKHKNIRILMPYRRERRKGTLEGLLVLKRVKKIHPNIEIILFGQKIPKDDFGMLEKDVRFYQSPVKDELRQLYNACDIFLYPPLEEGFGMPPMEAMACRLPVITTSAGAIPEYTIAGKTALVSSPGNIDTMTKNLLRLIEKPKERDRIAEMGYRYIQKFRWEDAANKLEQVFKKYI